MPQSKISTFFLRVSSSCNLNCNYCYVFKHQDDSWKNYPKFFSSSNLSLFIEKLIKYIEKTSLSRVLIVFHGGEPLLLGHEKLINYIDTIYNALASKVSVDFSIQSNGILLDEELANAFHKRSVSLSISIDGPAIIHDSNRKKHSGSGSHTETLRGIKIAQEYDILSGIITVINPIFAPTELFEFYLEQNLVNVDVLLPDANYITPPTGKDRNINIYKQWLIEAFDIWFKNYQSISIRTFELILQAVSGLPISSDFLGGGTLSYLTIETDGSYHTSDILKVAYNNASSTGLHLINDDISKVILSKKVSEYNSYLSVEGLPNICKKCEEVNICNGGSLPHRYNIQSGFNNPSVYCYEMKQLIIHIRKILTSELL